MEIVVEEHLNLVHSAINKLFSESFNFSNMGLERDDLFQIGCIGLIKSARSFKPELGFKFSTYAIPNIIGTIKKEINEKSVIKFPRFAHIIGHKLASKGEYDITVEQIAERFEKSIEDAEMIKGYLENKRSISLDKKVEQNNGSDTSIGDILGYDNFNLENYIIHKEELKEKISLLNNKEQYIVLETLNGKLQDDIAKELEISQAQVSRMLKKSIIKMQGIKGPAKKGTKTINGFKKSEIFTTLFKEGKSKEEIMETLAISSDSFYNYKSKYIKNNCKNDLNNINSTDKKAV